MNNLLQLPPEEQLKFSQPIIEDIIRAHNLANYSLLWRYLTDELATQISKENFKKATNNIAKEWGLCQTNQFIEFLQGEESLTGLWKLHYSQSNKEHLLKVSFVVNKNYTAISSLWIE